MLKDKIFLKRFMTLSLLFNSPALILPLFIAIDIEPTLLIFSFLMWANVPFLLGLGHLFNSSAVKYGEFGIMDSSAIVILTVIIFWIACAAILSHISIKFFNRTKV